LPMHKSHLTRAQIHEAGFMLYPESSKTNCQSEIEFSALHGKCHHGDNRINSKIILTRFCESRPRC
jgi:hypothetical protein